MNTTTIFRKVLVSESLPEKYGIYNTDVGLLEYSPHPINAWLCYPEPPPDEYWLEEIELPSEEEIERNCIIISDMTDEHHNIVYNDGYTEGWEDAINYILNHLTK